MSLALTTSTAVSIYASPTTEDDGYTYPDDASDEEKEEIDEQEQEAWEDAGSPGEQDNDSDDNGDDGDDGNDLPEPQQTFTCSDGSTVTGDDECPPTGPNPYCDKVGPNYRGSCHDRKDYSDITGLYSCNDETQKTDWRDCKDATEKRDDNNDNGETKTIHKTTVIQGLSASATATANANAADVSNCRLDGSANGIQQKFDTPKYLACGLYADGQKAYLDGFVVGCTQVGNTQLVCQSLVDSSILNTKTQPTKMATQPTQTQTQTTTQPTQAIQPATVDG